jgi:PAS domain S-box-containing protein
MKILYIANDRRAAELAALPLGTVAPDVKTTWVASLGEARRWVDENRDVAALIVEVESDSPTCESFVRQVRGMGVTAPVIVVSAKDPAPPLTVLKAVADAIVTRDLSFLNDLPNIVRRTINTARAPRPPRRRLRLLYAGDAALARECLGRPGGSIEVVGAVPGPGRKIDSLPADVRSGAPLPFDVVFIEHGGPGVETLAILKDLAARKRHVPVVIVADWDEELAVLALTQGASDYIVKSKASFRAVYFRLHRLIAHSALLNEQSKLRDAHAATVNQERANHADLVRRLAEAQTAREKGEQRLNEAVAAIKQARQDRLADAVAAAQEHARRECDFAARIAEATAATRILEQQLADRDAALRHAEQRATTEQHTLSQDFVRRQTELKAALAEEAARRRSLETTLAEADASHQVVEQRRLAEAAAFEDRLAQQHAEFTASIAQAVRVRDALEQRMNDAVAAIEQARQDRAAADAAAAEQLAPREAVLIAKLGHAATSQGRLERRLADADSALRSAEQRAAAEQHSARQLATERQAEFQAELARQTTSREALEQQLAGAKLALQRAEEHHASEATATEARFAEHQARYDARLSEAAAAQEALQGRLVAAEAALQGAIGLHASEMSDAAARLVESQERADARLAQAVAATKVVETKLADTVAALTRLEQRAAAERQAAFEAAAQRQANFETELTQEIARRQAVEAEFADARAASEQAQLRFLDEMAATRQRSRERETRLEERAAEERAGWESARIEAQERIRHLQMEGDLARRSLVTTDEQIRQLETAHQEERVNLERARMAIEADLARQRAEHTVLQQTLDQTRAADQETLERASKDRAVERARLEALVAERDTRLREQTARKQASDEAAAAALADVEHRLHLALAARDRDSRAIAQLQEQLKAFGEELEATGRQRELLKTAADRLPLLRKEIDDIRAEHRRRFDHTPVNMCRCGRDGTITQANHALASLLGYGTPEEVRRLDFAGSVFESADELQWIVARCLASRSTESIETTWRRKDGSRIVVRVLAVATAADSIDLVAEDITRVRMLEEKLRNSQRMEAVARYGSEVAVTCHTLLRHVKQEGQQWVERMESDTARYQGELLLDEVTRAAGFLGQLAAYGNEQKNIPELVDVNNVLRDLEPVLKRVAGDNIEIVLSTVSTPLNLDVEPGRVERMLVNVAAYGRERMPLGGRLMIEVASVVVDRTFVAKYPNVRPGAHVLLTVNEVRGAVRPDVSTTLRTQASAAEFTAPATDNPGVDLGALQALISDCGGHLWIMAEPPGNMVLKIHLPRRVLDRSDPRAPAMRPRRSRWIQRAFGARH